MRISPSSPKSRIVACCLRSDVLASGALAIATALLLTLLPTRARAVPLFARRYGTSCQTCHEAFPKLTPFGAAFRRNGHRFPDRADEDFRRTEPLALGADAYRDVFPEAVWPGELPSDVPLSLLLQTNALFTPDADLNFAGMGGNATLTASAPLGERFSAWVGMSLMASTDGTADVAIERVFATITPFDQPYLLFRLGAFEPDLLSFSSHRMFGYAPWILSTRVRDNEFSLEPTQIGIEASGVLLAGRATYSLGFVEGAGNGIGRAKDFYGHIGYKIGGLRLDGISGGEVNLAQPAPWREWSVQIGGFGYRGATVIGDPAVATQGDDFFVVGADINAQLRDANVILACSMGRNEQPDLSAPGQPVSNRQCMAQLDWVVFPWLIPTARVELRQIEHDSQIRITPGVYVLLRANVRAQVRASITGTDGHYALDQVTLGLALGL